MRFSRTRLLVGDEGIERLRAAHVALFGLGGVGSYALEALARAGVGHLLLVDFDTIEPSNINRQLLALDNTVGRAKVDVARERVALINPDARVETARTFVTPGNVGALLTDDIGHVVDAIDAVTPKIHLLRTLHGGSRPFVACMGAAAKRSPTAITVGDISETHDCPLARRVRQGLRRQGIRTGVRCVYTDEPPQAPGRPRQASDSAQTGDTEADRHRHRAPLGTISYVPGLIGLTAAGIIIDEIWA